MMRFSKPLITACSALLMSACTVLPESEPPRIVGLGDITPQQAAYQSPRPVSMRVDLPLASAPFDGTLVLIQPSNWEFQALPGTRWRDTMPVLVHDQLVQSLRASNGFDNVLAANSAANADISLLPELRGFHARQTNEGTAVVIHLYYELLQNRTRETLCVLDEKQVVPAQSTEIASLMEAFRQGTAEVAANTAQWAFDCLVGIDAD
ncbi:ABC-type transport auxiliary lipoprotein family protein [Marinobacter nauticus]